ncbi:hypothetical protein [Variovorax sp. CF079]|uniref:hypothetical protein n=1 Tax=Variovorax sp. CF079 TaxID=1882774 RepID=UPI001114105F|nr:hypothetical protein [Variovorax sp. CF079]
MTRITGKLLQESAIAGHRNLFLPSPTSATSSYVYVGSDPSGTPLFEVPGEFYAAVFSRIEALFGPGAVDSVGERTVAYGGRSFAISISVPSAERCGVTLGIRPVDVEDANARDAR